MDFWIFPFFHFSDFSIFDFCDFGFTLKFHRSTGTFAAFLWLLVWLGEFGGLMRRSSIAYCASTRTTYVHTVLDD